MFTPPDIRFAADAAQAVAAGSVVFPVTVVVERPAGVAEARRVADEFARACAAADIPGGALAPSGAGGRLSVRAKPGRDGAMVVGLGLSATLSFAGPAEFWGRATAVSLAVDAVHRFARGPWAKGIDVYAPGPALPPPAPPG